MNKKIICISIIGMFLLTSLACLSAVGVEVEVSEKSEPDGDVFPANLTGFFGYVYDEVTGEPIEEVKVALYSWEFVSGPFGKIKFPVILKMKYLTEPDGWYHALPCLNHNIFIVTGKGYVPEFQRVDWPPGEHGVNVNFYLKPIL